MTYSEFQDVGIRGVVTTVPSKKTLNSEFGSLFTDEICSSDLCCDKSSIDALLFVSQTPDFTLSSKACVLQHRLGLSSDCVSMDVNLGCSRGYVSGVYSFQEEYTKILEK